MAIAKGSRQPRVTLPKKVLKVLRQSPLPVSTPDLCVIVRQKLKTMWCELVKLEKAGVVRRELRIVRREWRNQWGAYTRLHPVAFWHLTANLSECNP